MAETKIEWTHLLLPNGKMYPGYTCNFWIGCSKVSPGCKFCYAEEQMDLRYGRVQWGVNGTRIRTKLPWDNLKKWNDKSKEDGFPSSLDDPSYDVRPRVFTQSLSDTLELRDDLIPWREEAFNLMKKYFYLDFMVLTKRHENLQTMLPWMITGEDPYANFWIGVSVENQEYAEKRIPVLQKTPAHLRFLSVEPLLDEVDLTGLLDGIHWVIVGGESGDHSRPFITDWARKIIKQCKDAGVACFIKQLGKEAFDETTKGRIPLRLKDSKGGRMDEWNRDLRIREYPKSK